MSEERKRILVAEDEPSIVLSLEFLLNDAGYDVITAADGAQALDAASTRPPDVVILDIMLPLVDGFEVCRTLRATPRHARTPILMLSARGREQEVERGLALGANAYLTKPFATRDLLQTVKALLDGTQG